MDSNKVSEESLRLPKNYKNQSPWKREKQLCVCQDPNSSLGGAICSANEEETCSSTVEHKGYSLLPTSRLKRDARYINLDFERRMIFDIEDSYEPGERVKVCIKIVSEYDQEIPQSQTADQHMASRERATQQSQDTS